MKFLAGLAAAASLASSAAAAVAASAPVYLLRSSSSSSPSSSQPSAADAHAAPVLPRQIARQVLLQRLGASDGSSFYGTLPRNWDPETALELIEQFGGKAASALFADETTAAQPREMLVVVQGAQPEHVAALEAALPAAFAQPAFFVADAPSEAANTRFFVDELADEGVVAQRHTSASDAVAAGRPASWTKGVFVGFYDAKKVRYLLWFPVLVLL